RLRRMGARVSPAMSGQMRATFAARTAGGREASGPVQMMDQHLPHDEPGLRLQERLPPAAGRPRSEGDRTSARRSDTADERVLIEDRPARRTRRAPPWYAVALATPVGAQRPPRPGRGRRPAPAGRGGLLL